MNFTFNDIRKNYIIATRIGRPFRAPRKLNIITVIGMAGGHVSSVEDEPMIIPVRVEITGNDRDDYFDRCEEVAAWLTTDKPEPLIFDDRPSRTYYAMLLGNLDPEEIVSVGYVDIQFICPDPYKYGQEKTTNLSDAIIVNNEGTAEANPIFELTATKKTTFAMVSNGEEYNLIGKPADDDVQVVDTRTSILYENGSTISDWQVANTSMIDSNFLKNISGTMGTDGAGIRASSYGTGDSLHGPAVYKEIDPIQDFEIETTFDIISRREIENFRIGINFLDENMRMLGHIGIKDGNKNYKQRVPLARFGTYRGSGRQNGNLIGDNQANNNARETTLFYLRVKRVGKRFEFYIGEWYNQKHVRNWTGLYVDKLNEFQGKLKYITLYTASYADRVLPARLRMNSVEVFELAQATQDETPYILFPGDIVTFDHKNNDILVNGEPRNDLKNFGGSFFKLDKGDNTILVTPEDSFTGTVKYRDKYL